MASEYTSHNNHKYSVLQIIGSVYYQHPLITLPEFPQLARLQTSENRSLDSLSNYRFALLTLRVTSLPPYVPKLPFLTFPQPSLICLRQTP